MMRAVEAVVCKHMPDASAPVIGHLVFDVEDVIGKECVFGPRSAPIVHLYDRGINFRIRFFGDDDDIVIDIRILHRTADMEDR